MLLAKVARYCGRTKATENTEFLEKAKRAAGLLSALCVLYGYALRAFAARSCFIYVSLGVKLRFPQSRAQKKCSQKSTRPRGAKDVVTFPGAIGRKRWTLACRRSHGCVGPCDRGSVSQREGQLPCQLQPLRDRRDENLVQSIQPRGSDVSFDSLQRLEGSCLLLSCKSGGKVGQLPADLAGLPCLCTDDSCCLSFFRQRVVRSWVGRIGQALTRVKAGFENSEKTFFCTQFDWFFA